MTSGTSTMFDDLYDDGGYNPRTAVLDTAPKSALYCSYPNHALQGLRVGAVATPVLFHNGHKHGTDPSYNLTIGSI